MTCWKFWYFWNHHSYYAVGSGYQMELLGMMTMGVVRILDRTRAQARLGALMIVEKWDLVWQTRRHGQRELSRDHNHYP